MARKFKFSLVWLEKLTTDRTKNLDVEVQLMQLAFSPRRSVK